MAGATPKLAFETFIDQTRRVLQCVGQTGAFGSGYAPGEVNTLTLTPRGRGAGDPVPLRARSGRRDLHLQIAFQYSVALAFEDLPGRRFVVSTHAYSYFVLDGNEQEVLVYQWHPEGVSPYRLPHLHLSIIPSLTVAQRGEPRGQGRSVTFGNAHLPTGMVFLKDIVELLVVEFDVEPLRADWIEVVAEARTILSHRRFE